MEQVGGRGQGVRDGVPDIPAAVAVHIDSIGQVAGRDKLGVAHGAGPGTAELLDLDIARLEYLQGADELGAPEFCPPGVGVSQGRQGLGNIVEPLGLLQHRTVVGFHRPDGQQDAAADAEFFGHGRQGAVVEPIHALAFGDGDRVYPAVKILPDLGGELGLVAGFFQHPVIDSLNPCKSPVPGARAHSLLTGNRPELFKPSAEIAARLAGPGPRSHKQEAQEYTHPADSYHSKLHGCFEILDYLPESRGRRRGDRI